MRSIDGLHAREMGREMRVGRSRANVGRAYVDTFVAWDRLRVCAWIVGDRVVTQTWGLRVRSTTTSDDAVTMMRFIATRDVGVSPSLFRRPLVLLF